MSETIPTMINDSSMTASLKATRRLEIVRDLKQKNEERGALLESLDAMFTLEDCCPEMLDQGKRLVSTQWVGFRGELRLIVKWDDGSTTELADKLVPSSFERPEVC